jgi:hypothetical protein
MDTPQNTNPSNKSPTNSNLDIERLANLMIGKLQEQYDEGLEAAALLHDKAKAGYASKASNPVTDAFIELHTIFAKAIRDLKQE